METNFCDHGSLREFVCELFPITQNKPSIFQSSYRTHETVDITLGLFRSSWFVSGLTMFGLRKHQLAIT